ncbi:MAG: DUF58 domain-containing protein [Acidimicrobiia bacterium]
MPARTAVLTRRGWSLLGAAVGLVVAGRLLGTSELTTLGLAGVALIGGCVLWTRTRLVPLQVTRDVRPERIAVGTDARVDLEVSASAPSPQVTLTDAFDRGRRAARFLLPALERGQHARAAYRIPTDRRGRFSIGPAVVGISDPFGLTVRTTTLDGATEAIVRPRVHELQGIAAAPGQRRAAVTHRARVLVPSPTHDEFLALREYDVGDDLRRIHWRSTARVGELMVREDEAAWQPQTVLVLDNRAGAHQGGSYEAAIEATASIALRLGKAGRSIEILTTAGRRLGGSVTEQLRADTLLDELALLRPDPDAPLSAAVRRLRAPSRRGLLVVVTGAPTDVAAFGALAGPGAPVTLVVCGDAAIAATGHLTVVDGRPGRLVASWNAIPARRRGPRRGRATG